jgi:hypothetical protein
MRSQSTIVHWPLQALYSQLSAVFNDPTTRVAQPPLANKQGRPTPISNSQDRISSTGSQRSGLGIGSQIINSFCHALQGGGNQLLLMDNLFKNVADFVEPGFDGR